MLRIPETILSQSRENFDLRSPDGNASRVAIQGWLTLDAAKRLLTASGRDFEALKKSAARRDFQPVPLDAKVSFVEYGDFECPACGEYYPVVQQLVQNYSSTVLFVFRNFPLYTIHPFAGISRSTILPVRLGRLVKLS